MAKELLVNVSRGEEVRVALVEEGRLEEIYLERDNAASNVGNIYLGKVTNVEGSIQAAFVDFGYGRNGFLHVQDLHPDYFPEGGRWDNMTERVGKKIGRRDRPPIQDALRRGDRIVVQIIKEGIGTKGPTLTSYPSIPGRFLVMMPGVEQMGVSKNIEDEEERRRLRKVLDGLKPPKHVGFIIRTAGLGKTKIELERDFKYLVRLNDQIESARKNAKPPTLLYSEGDLVTRVVRDVWTPDVDRVVVDDAETALRIKQFFKLLMPRTKVNVQLYQGNVPLFHAGGVEREIETMFSRHVPMEGGASLVIDSTEAVVAIDVNSGKFREHGDAEETAFAVDMIAAEEICRQLRLRDLGGVVICDFIDLRYSRHREALFNRLTDLFKRDKAKSRHLEMNEFGIVCITRQRMRADLKKSVFMPCPWSGGTGFIKTPESMALDVMRRLRVAAADERVERIDVRLFPMVAMHVLNSKRGALAELETRFNKPITLRSDDSLAADEVAMEPLDERETVVQIEDLMPPEVELPDSGGQRRRRRRGRGGRDRDDRQKSHGNGQADVDEETGLIDLPDLMELGELKLDAVEALVEDLAGGREEADRDPNSAILTALRDGSLLADEEEQPENAAEPARNGEARQDQPDEEQEGDGTRRRGRRRRRGGRGGEGGGERQEQERADARSTPEESFDGAPDESEEFDDEPVALDEPLEAEVDVEADEPEPVFSADAMVARYADEDDDDDARVAVSRPPSTMMPARPGDPPRGAAKPAAQAAAAPARAATQAQEPREASGESGASPDGERTGRRRRRRRGRRNRGGGDGQDQQNPQGQPSQDGPRQNRPSQERSERKDRDKPRDKPKGEPTDDHLDAKVNGNRAEAETHRMIRDPIREAEHDTDAGDTGRGGKRRGRRRGRGSGGSGGAQVYTSGDEQPTPTQRLKAMPLDDDALDARVNGNRIDHRQEARTGPSVPGKTLEKPSPKTPAVYREDDDEEHEQPPQLAGEDRPAAAADEESGPDEAGGRPKRRRRRRRGGRSRETPQDVAVTTAVEDVSDTEGAVADTDEVVTDASKSVETAGDEVQTPEADEPAVPPDMEPQDLPAAISGEAVVEAELEAAAAAPKKATRKKATKKTPKKAAPKKAPAKKAPAKKAAKKVVKKTAKKAAPKKAAKAGE